MSQNFHTIINEFAKKQKLWVGTSFFLMVIQYPLELIVLSYLSGKIFTMMSNMKMNYNKVFRLTIYLFLVYFFIEMTIITRDIYDSYIVPHLEREIRNRVVSSVMEKNEIQYDQLEMGELVARFLKTPAYSMYSYVVVTKFIIPFIASIICLGFYILYLNRKVGLLYFVMFSVYSILIVYCCKEMLQITKNKMTEEMDMFNKIEDTLSNIQTIYTSDTIEKEKNFINEEQHKFIKVHQQEMRLNTKFKMILSSYCLVAVMVLFVMAIRLYRKKQISQETLVSMVTLFLFMCRFLGYTSRRILEGMVTIGSFMDSNDFLTKLVKDTFQDGTQTNFITEGKITFHHIFFRYSKKSPYVFEDLNLVIPPRSTLLLMGDSGSGKTTFLRLILGFYVLEKGSIFIDDTDIANSKRSYLRNKIAYINQTTKLFDRTILENILYGCQNASRRDVELFLQQNNLLEMFNKTPNGLDTIAGKGGEKLSGGMRQIILLIRCYFKDCPIVILDECTANIGAKHRQHAITIIKTMFVSKTVIAVSHDNDIISLFNRRLVFQNDKPPYIQ